MVNESLGDMLEIIFHKDSTQIPVIMGCIITVKLSTIINKVIIALWIHKVIVLLLLIIRECHKMFKTGF